MTDLPHNPQPHPARLYQWALAAVIVFVVLVVLGVVPHPYQ